MTIHKSQGLTLDKAWLDLGKQESVAGLAYVALSRVRHLHDLVIEPKSLDRLNGITKHKNFQFRLQEEARLDSLASITAKTFQNIHT